MEDQLKQQKENNLKYYTYDDNLKMFKLKIKNVKLHKNQNNVIPLKKRQQNWKFLAQLRITLFIISKL